MQERNGCSEGPKGPRGLGELQEHSVFLFLKGLDKEASGGVGIESIPVSEAQATFLLRTFIFQP